jgi:hypothetical protein
MNKFEQGNFEENPDIENKLNILIALKGHQQFLPALSVSSVNEIISDEASSDNNADSKMGAGGGLLLERTCKFKIAGSRVSMQSGSDTTSSDMLNAPIVFGII